MKNNISKKDAKKIVAAIAMVATLALYFARIKGLDKALQKNKDE